MFRGPMCPFVPQVVRFCRCWQVRAGRPAQSPHAKRVPRGMKQPQGRNVYKNQQREMRQDDGLFTLAVALVVCRGCGPFGTYLAKRIT